MFKKIFVSILAIFLFAGAVQAQDTELPDPGMLPNSPFYFLKTWTENVGTFFTFNEEAKAERMLHLSERRLAEAKALSEQGETELAEKTIGRYEEQLNSALEKARSARGEGKEMEDLFIRVSEATYKHQDVLMDVYDKVPEQAKENIQRAMDESMRGHEEALESIPFERQEEVMERVQEKMKNIEMPDINEIKEKEIMLPEQVPSMDTVMENIPGDIQIGRP